MTKENGKDEHITVSFGKWGSIVGQLGAVAVMCWFLWFMVAHELPRIQAEFHGDLKDERSAHIEIMKNMEDHFDKRNQVMMKQIADQNDAIIKALRNGQDSLIIMGKSLDTNQKMIMDLHKSVNKMDKELHP